MTKKHVEIAAYLGLGILAAGFLDSTLASLLNPIFNAIKFAPYA